VIESYLWTYIGYPTPEGACRMIEITLESGCFFMEGKMEWTKGLCVSLVFVLAVFLFSCGGEDSTSGLPNDAEAPNGTSGVVVDPYIAGASFQEVLEDGTFGQISSPSDDKGQFKFSIPLSIGSTVVMVETGVHNGSPYLGDLKAQEHHVDANGRLIVSPVTTLLCNYEEIGYTEAEAETKVITLLEDAGLNVTGADLVKDSMEAANQDGDLKPLQSNMSINSFLQALKKAGRQSFDVEDEQTYERDLLTFQQLLADLVGMILSDLSSTDLVPFKSEIEAMLGASIPPGYQLELNDLILSLITRSDYTAGQVAEDILEDGLVDVPVQNWVGEKSLKKLILLNFVARVIDDVDFETFYASCQDNNKDLPDVISGETFPPDEIPRYWYSANFASVLKPMVRMDSKGNAIAIWEQRNPTEWSIFVSHYSIGQGWGEPILIENEAGGGLNPFIDIDDDGNAMAIWEQADGVKMSIMASYYTFGDGWGTPVYIEDNNQGNAHSPKFSFDGAGNAIAVWRVADGLCTQGAQTFGVYNVYTNRFVKDVGWGNAELLENGCWDAGYNGFDIAMDAAGNGIAAWTQQDGIQYNLMYRIYTPDSGWGTEGFVEENPDSVYDPQLAIDDAGNVMAVWYQNDGGIQSVYANHFGSSSGWGIVENIESGNLRATRARVGMDADGNAMAVWYQSDGSNSNIMANRFVSGSGWSGEFVVDSEDLGDAYHPQVAVNSKGDAIVAWEQSDGSRFNVWAKFFDVKYGWGEAKIIDSDLTGDASDASVALSNLGTGVAIWLQTGGVTANDYR
jgi:hypothetical protein